MSMNSKERVLTAIHREIPDRVPAALWGSYYTLNDGLYFKTLDYLNIGEPLPPFRRKMPRNSNYYDDRILDRLETDMRYVWSGFTDIGGARMDGDRRDAWGVEWQRMGPHITSVGAPLKGVSIDQVADYDWPDPEKYLDFDLMKSRISYLKREYPHHAIGARAVNSYGPFEQAAELRGRESFYMDMVTNPDLAQLIVDRCTDVIVRAQELYLDRIWKDIDFFEIPGDDFGGTQDLLISPDSFDRMFKSSLKRIVDSVKNFKNDLPVVFHSDGAITKIIPRLIEAGIDILNPLEPLPAMDWAGIKRRYADRLCFMGGVDLKKALTGTVHDVQEDVKRCIRTFGEGGGYILTSANHIQVDVPPENVVALFKAGKAFGTYPLDLD
jgi:uroporphyrinogen decarboxylase